MALFVDRRSGSAVTAKLKEVSSPLPSGYPIYELDDSDATSTCSSDFGSDDDDASFADALEEQPAPRDPLVVPEEVLEIVFRATQRWVDDSETLKSAALVCRSWSTPARRILFSQNIYINSPEAVKRLRHVVDSRPELRSAMQHFDLANPCSTYDIRLNETFRRAAGILRLALCVKTLNLLHVPLSDKTRRKFFGALRALPMEEVRLYAAASPSYGPFGPRRRLRGTADVDVLPGLLQQWSTLRSLTLSGYSTYPRLFSGALLLRPVPPMPTYRLVELNLVSTDLSGATLLWLLGDSLASLRVLNLSTCTGLTKDVLEHVCAFVGPTLECLYLALDLDDLDPASASAPLDSAILAPLVNLASFTLSSDTLFPDTLLVQLVALPSLSLITLCCPSFSHDIVKRAVATLPAPSASSSSSSGSAGGARRRRLEQLTLDAWELQALWSEEERWEVLQACEDKGVQVVINGLAREDIEDEWYGEDMTDAWHALEDLGRSSTASDSSWSSRWGRGSVDALGRRAR
ncbi:uncharacterized protein RHOBADRAFT_52056 [Rhodotorula graminis WP1]|uniref:F-box domain-containing protein n=1 Tax=Rhodotorula graminis (strain WP1) TaxID=578459 RepID=A0A194SCI3_RHOGW|nr:uncharacterized protein RHOBADRAFT_52056 [Rhodotorula graminis WP1]KPV77101.1 hypothetical protein RHOBADRAFT_52056 [Rhodotorula graminis WP1]